MRFWVRFGSFMLVPKSTGGGWGGSGRRWGRWWWWRWRYGDRGWDDECRCPRLTGRPTTGSLGTGTLRDTSPCRGIPRVHDLKGDEEPVDVPCPCPALVRREHIEPPLGQELTFHVAVRGGLDA